jgi:hypothetical protein
LIGAQGAQPTRRYTVLNFPLGTVYFHAKTTPRKMCQLQSAGNRGSEDK